MRNFSRTEKILIAFGGTFLMICLLLVAQLYLILKPTVIIQNQTGQTLRHVKLVLEQHDQRIGHIEPGQKVYAIVWNVKGENSIHLSFEIDKKKYESVGRYIEPRWYHFQYTITEKNGQFQTDVKSPPTDPTLLDVIRYEWR